MLQRPQTYYFRTLSHDILLQQGPKTLNELEQLTGIPKEKIYYAIESTSPFEAMFRKRIDRAVVYEAVPIDEVYGEEDFY